MQCAVELIEVLVKRIMKTCAKRKLLLEAEILQIKHRVSLGVPLNAAVKLIVPHISNVAAIKLVNLYAEAQEALNEDDFVLHDCIHNSLFPDWLPGHQPDEACYIGQFPYGYWEINNG